ncbi:MAG: ATP phosphoribosyltransferase [Acidobacteriota bacterium]
MSSKIRLALPKGRNLGPTLEAFRAAGSPLQGIEKGDRRLRVEVPELGWELLLLKDWDLPLYVEYGIADFGVVGSDVLEEVGGDLLVPARFTHGRSRLSLIGRKGLPRPGEQVRLASKYPNIARAVLAHEPWGAEVLKLWGSVELGPLLDLAEVALDIVQTGRTLKENHLEELVTVREVAPVLVVNRAAYQQHRAELTDLIGRLEGAGMVEV